MQSPNEHLSPPAYPKALRVQRLAAFLIDQLILTIIVTPLVLFMGYGKYFQGASQIPYIVLVNLNIFMFVAFLLVNGRLLYRYGQTVGKRYMKIAIATYDFKIMDFNRLIALRYLPFAAAGLIPLVAIIQLVDVLLIFREDRSCLHDKLAKTQVIDVSSA